MTSTFLLRHLSFDRVGVALTMTGCLAVLVDANHKGRAPLQGSVPASKGDALGRVFTKQQCRQLEREGYLVVDNFLNQQQVQEARQSIQELDAGRQFRASPDDDSTTPALTRTRDRVLVNRKGSLDLVRQQIAGFAKSLVDSDFRGFPTDEYHSSVLRMPAQMQVSICSGTQSQEKDPSVSHHGEESSFVASTHNFFHKHLDSAGANHLGELGVLGWLRSQHLRRRYLTCLVYLNPDWKEGDGGCLRLFTGNEGDHDDELDGEQDVEAFVDIPPLAGRMVVFSSPRQVHAVLPTNVQRYACAVWLAL